MPFSFRIVRSDVKQLTGHFKLNGVAQLAGFQKWAVAGSFAIDGFRLKRRPTVIVGAENALCLGLNDFARFFQSVGFDNANAKTDEGETFISFKK